MQIELRRKQKYVKRMRRFLKNNRTKGAKGAKRNKKPVPPFNRGVYRRNLREAFDYYRLLNIGSYYHYLREEDRRIEKKFLLDRRVIKNNIYKRYFDTTPLAAYNE